MTTIYNLFSAFSSICYDIFVILGSLFQKTDEGLNYIYKGLYILGKFVSFLPLFLYGMVRLAYLTITQSLNYCLHVFDVFLGKIDQSMQRMTDTLYFKYSSLGHNPSVYGFIFVKNIPFYFIRSFHLVVSFVLIATSRFIHTLAFIFSKITPPSTYDLLIFYYNDAFNVNYNYYDYEISNADWLLNKLKETESTTDAYFETKISKLYSDKQNMNKRPSNKFLINLGLFFKNLFTGFIQFFQDKLLWPLLMISRGLVDTIIKDLIISCSMPILFLLIVLEFRHTAEFVGNIIAILVLPVITLIGDENHFIRKSKGLIYLSFEVCKSIFTQTIDIVVELLSLIFDILGLSLNTTFQFFTDSTFDYGDFIVSPALNSESLKKGISYQKETAYDQDGLPLLSEDNNELSTKL